MGRPPKDPPVRKPGLVPGKESAPGSALPPDLLPIDEGLGVAAFLVRNGADDVYAYVRRRNGDVWEFVAKLPATELDEIVLQREYGGGTYEIRVQRPNGQFVGQPLRVVIAGVPKLPAVAQPDLPKSPAESGMNLLMQTMQMQTALLGSLMQNVAKPPSLTDLLNALAPLLAERGKSSSSGELDLFLKGVQFKSELPTGEAAPPDAMTTAIDKLAVPLLEAAKAQRDRPAPTVRAALVNPSSKPPMPHWIDRLRPYLPLLVSAAVQNRDVTEIAGPLLTMLPQEIFDVIALDATHDVNFVARTVDAVLERAPRLEARRAWLTQLAETLRAEIADMQRDQASPGGDDEHAE